MDEIEAAKAKLDAIRVAEIEYAQALIACKLNGHTVTDIAESLGQSRYRIVAAINAEYGRLAYEDFEVRKLAPVILH